MRFNNYSWSSSVNISTGQFSSSSKLSLGSVVVRKFKRLVLPLHRTFKRFVVLTGLGILVFLLYVVILERYLSKRVHRVPVIDSIGRLPIKEQGNITRQRYGFYNILIEPKKSEQHLFFLILTSSSPWDVTHQLNRAAIRETWAKCKTEEIDAPSSKRRLSCRQVFFMGRTHQSQLDGRISDEASQFGDIIVGDMFDTYRNITHKLLLALNWATKQNFKYLLKTDDDIYVNIPNLYLWLTSPETDLPKDLYGGVLYNGIVVRDPRHKHFVKQEDFGESYYPPYVKGSHFILSGHLVLRLIQASTRVRRFNIDDAYIGIVLNKIKVFPTNINRYIQFKHVNLMTELLHHCDFKWILSLGDGLNPGQLHTLHKQFLLHLNENSWMCYNLPPIAFHLFLVLFLVGILLAVFGREHYS